MYHKLVDNPGEWPGPWHIVYTLFVYILNLCIACMCSVYMPAHQIMSMPTLSLGLAQGSGALLTCVSLVQVSDFQFSHKGGVPPGLHYT